MFTFSQLGMCNVCSHFPLCFDDELGGYADQAQRCPENIYVLNDEKWKQWTSNRNVYGGQILNSCQAVWLGSIQVEGCWAFVMVQRRGPSIFLSWSQICGSCTCDSELY